MNSSVQAKIIMNLINSPDTVVTPLSYVDKRWKHYYYILPISYNEEIMHRLLRKSHRASLLENAAWMLGLVLVAQLKL